MHPAALQWAKENVPEFAPRVLDIGGADINCSLRSLYTWSEYTCVDIAPGPDVTVVADFIEWASQFWPPDRSTAGRPFKPWDLVVCFEVFEHTEAWPRMIDDIHALLAVGGLFVGTCAGIGRTPHSAWGDPHPRPGEHYQNVSAEALAYNLDREGFTEYTIDRARSGLDLRWKAVKT